MRNRYLRGMHPHSHTAQAIRTIHAANILNSLYLLLIAYSKLFRIIVSKDGREMPKDSRDTRKVIARLCREGWIMRQGKGDHVNFSRPGFHGIITIDSGEKQVKKPVYNRIKRITGWE